MHTAIAADCFRLMQASTEVCDAFKNSTIAYASFARLGAITWGGDTFTVTLLSDIRRRWATRECADRLEPKLGFVLAWLTHRAADRQMKPVFRETDPVEQRTQSPSEPSVYHDALAFRELFDEGNDAPYRPAMFEDGYPSLPAAHVFDVPAAEHCFRACFKQVLGALHNFQPDRESMAEWLDRLLILQ